MVAVATVVIMLEWLIGSKRPRPGVLLRGLHTCMYFFLSTAVVMLTVIVVWSCFILRHDGWLTIKNKICSRPF